MKKICLIETSTVGLRIIKSYLSEMNAQCELFSSVRDVVKTNTEFDLVVLLAQQNSEFLREDLDTLQNAPSFTKIPRIILLPGESPKDIQIAEISELQTSFRMSPDKLQFLTTAAKLLKIPPRRVMQIIVTVQPEGSKVRYMGVSVDFSENGMAFECDGEFATAQNISVSFVNPAIKQRMLLPARIVRKAPSIQGNKSFYGAMFHSLTAQDAKDLIRFVTGRNY